jgi:nucleoside-diphosphate-sugar epimerase
MILITGSNGFLGSNLVYKFDELNEKLKLLGRANSSLHSHPYFQHDLNEHEIYYEALIGVDTVIHCAASLPSIKQTSVATYNDFYKVNVLGTLNLASQALNAGVKRFIFISSIKVNGEATKLGKPFKSTDKPSPEDFYGQSKLEAEDQLFNFAKHTGLEVVIIRPTLIYGPGVKGNFASLLNLVSKGLPLPFGCISNNKRSLVSVANLVDFIITCIDHPKAANQVFLISDDNDVSTASMIREMCKALGKRSIMLPVPLWCFSLTGKLFGKQDVVNRLLGSLQVDMSHTKDTLDWVSPQTIEHGFKETAQAFLKNKEKNNDSTN